MDERVQMIKTEDKSDRISQHKTIYEAGAGEIFWKNFLAGFSRTLGGIFIYLLFLTAVGWIFYTQVMPKFMPLITSVAKISNSLDSITNTKSGAENLFPKNLDLLNIIGK